MTDNPTHWYVSPVDRCLRCQRPHDDPIHKRKCSSIAASHRPGWGFCRLAQGHTKPHEYVWWDGEVTRNGETIEASTRIVQIGEDDHADP